ncbi:MAG: TonB family protein [Candidatus Fermentibacteraceae bacterium]
MRHYRRARKGPSPAELGTVFSLSLVLVALEAFPSTSFGRLAQPAQEAEMTGYEAAEIYDVPLPETPEPEIDVDEIIRDELTRPEPDQVVALDPDPAGLDTAATVDLNRPDETPAAGPSEIPSPGTFVPHSSPPACTYRPSADYPSIARQAGVEGRVTLQVFVSTGGDPERVVVVQGSGLASMDSSAVASARQTRWAPAQRADGRPVGVWTSMVYDFVLE